MAKYLSDAIFFFDFDGTLTSQDTLDLFFEKNISSDESAELSLMWENGIIGSRECLTTLFSKCVNFTDYNFESVLNIVKVPDNTIELLQMLKARGAQAYIISDGIDLMINSFLKKNNLIKYFSKIYANSIKINKEKGRITFIPNSAIENKCKHKLKCALCKETTVYNIINKQRPRQSFYIGDGRSDIYGAQICDVVFAKKGLFDLIDNTEKILFCDFLSIIKYFDSY